MKEINSRKQKEAGAADIKIVGIGPGHPDYLTPRAIKELESCSLIMGSLRSIATIKKTRLNRTCTKINFSQGLEKEIARELKENQPPIAVAVTGDPGFFSLAKSIREKFPRRNITTIPGLSSVQYLTAACNLTWQNFTFSSCHGRELPRLTELIKDNVLALLTDAKNNPGRLAALLVEEGFADIPVIIGENLSYVEERIIRGRAEEIASENYQGLAVMLIGYELEDRISTRG